MTEVTVILNQIQKGDANAAQALLPVVYEELRRLAAHKMAQERAGHTLQPTALVHEAWLRVAGPAELTWENRAHFFGAAAEAMRRILIESARRRMRRKRGGHLERIDLEEIAIAVPERDETLLAVDEALSDLEKDDPSKARVVKLKFFAGLTNQEVAQSLGVTERTVERTWAYAKAWLFRTIQAKR